MKWNSRTVIQAHLRFTHRQNSGIPLISCVSVTPSVWVSPVISSSVRFSKMGFSRASCYRNTNMKTKQYKNTCTSDQVLSVQKTYLSESPRFQCQSLLLHFTLSFQHIPYAQVRAFPGEIETQAHRLPREDCSGLTYTFVLTPVGC